MQSRSQERESGLALVSVLWALTILSLIASVIIFTARQSAYLESFQSRHLVRQGLFEATLHRAILGLLDTRPEQRWRVDSTPYKFEWNGTVAEIRIQDELGKIDLNSANDELLRGLFRSVDTSVADQLTDRVLDWRGNSGLKRLNGAAESDYRSAGSSMRPRGGAFQSIDELRLVLGMGDDFYARIKPAITIYSQKTTIDPDVAPRGALLALPGYDEDRTQRLIESRKPSLKKDDTDPSAASRLTDLPVSLSGRAFSISMSFSEEGMLYAETVVIRITDAQRGHYWILDID